MICNVCKKEKSLNYFHKNKNNKNGLQRRCKPCHIKYVLASRRLHKERDLAYHKAYIRKHKVLLFEYLSDKSCIDCGINNPILFEFDHVRGVKSFSITKKVSMSFETKLKEIEKCEIRCANCHRFKTAKERNYLIYKYFYGDEV